jgi:hypothetical protein
MYPSETPIICPKNLEKIDEKIYILYNLRKTNSITVILLKAFTAIALAKYSNYYVLCLQFVTIKNSDGVRKSMFLSVGFYSNVASVSN